MRFILKCTFWLGLVAFLLPFGEHQSETAAEISWIGAFAGAQEALQDLGGFCDRAPKACETGREAALFASERVADGIAIAYGFIDDQRAPATNVAENPAKRGAGESASPDPLMTGGVASGSTEHPLPRAYTAPHRATAAPDRAPAHSAPPVIPTPSPRA